MPTSSPQMTRMLGRCPAGACCACACDWASRVGDPAASADAAAMVVLPSRMLRRLSVPSARSAAGLLSAAPWGALLSVLIRASPSSGWRSIGRGRRLCRARGPAETISIAPAWSIGGLPETRSGFSLKGVRCACTNAWRFGDNHTKFHPVRLRGHSSREVVSSSSPERPSESSCREGAHMNTSARRRSRRRKALAGTFALGVITAASTTAKADFGGLSFWLPGLMGSLSAVPGQPGWSIAYLYVHDDARAGGDKEFQRGGSLVAGLHANADALAFMPSYTFETPVFGGRASVSLAGIPGRVGVNIDATLTGPRGRQITGHATDSRSTWA